MWWANFECLNSVEGRLPRLRYSTQKFLNDPKYAYSQSYRIDAMHALQNVKKGNPIDVWFCLDLKDLSEIGTSLPRYYSYYPHFESARDRYTFVPKYFPNENPSYYEHKGLQHFKDVCFQKCFISLIFYFI